MKLSWAGYELIKDAEGFRDRVYRDTAGYQTVGYGHKLTADEKRRGDYQVVTRKTAQALLEADVARAEDGLRRYVRVPLTQNQWDALVCFVFNVGVAAFGTSTLLRLLNAGETDAIPEQLRRWNKETKGGFKVVSTGLINRREREVQQWLS